MLTHDVIPGFVVGCLSVGGEWTCGVSDGVGKREYIKYFKGRLEFFRREVVCYSLNVISLPLVMD